MKNNEITSRNQWPVKRGRTDGLSARRRRTAVMTGAGWGTASEEKRVSR